jgi:hypothetical protein
MGLIPDISHLLLRIFSTWYSSSPSTKIGFGASGAWQPGIGSSGVGVNNHIKHWVKMMQGIGEV